MSSLTGVSLGGGLLGKNAIPVTLVTGTGAVASENVARCSSHPRTTTHPPDAGHEPRYEVLAPVDVDNTAAISSSDIPGEIPGGNCEMYSVRLFQGSVM